MFFVSKIKENDFFEKKNEIFLQKAENGKFLVLPLPVRSEHRLKILF